MENAVTLCVPKVEDHKPILCRICLLSGERFVSISDEISGCKIFEHITSFTNVLVDPDDDFPKFICPSCFTLLEGAITLRSKCCESESILRKIQLKADIEIKNIKEEYIDNVEDEQIEYEATQYLEPFLDSDSSPVRDLDGSPSLIPTPAKGQLFSPQCNECKQYFRSKCKLRVHWKKEHLKQSLMCQYCKRAFKSCKAFAKHRRNDKLCADMMTNSDKFTIIGEGKKRLFKCKYCEYTADRFNHMRTHFVVHVVGEKPYKCDICSQTYSQKISLRSHIMEVHEKKSRVTCHVCGKELPSGRRFYRHMIVHRVPKIPCPVCKRLFKSNHRLNIHKKRHSDRKEYQCEICPKSFYTQSELCNHRRVHKPGELLSCNDCNFCTRSVRTMKTHQTQHEANKEFPCLKCGRFYDSEQRLRVHLRKYHKPKIVPCPFCPNVYEKAKSVRMHIKYKHRDKLEEKVIPTINFGVKTILLPKQSLEEDSSNTS